MRYMLGLVLLVGCASSEPDVCADVRAQGECNGVCAERFPGSTPGYAECVHDCAATYHDNSGPFMDCVGAGGSASDCLARYPQRMVPPGGCYADAGAGPDA